MFIEPNTQSEWRDILELSLMQIFFVNIKWSFFLLELFFLLRTFISSNMNIYLICHNTIITKFYWFMKAKTINNVFGFLKFKFKNNLVKMQNVILFVFIRVRLFILLRYWAFLIDRNVKFSWLSFNRRLRLERYFFGTFGDFESFRSLKFEDFFIDPNVKNKLGLLERCKHDILHNFELNHFLWERIEHKNEIVIIRCVIFGLEEMSIGSK